MKQHLGLTALIVREYDEALAFYVGKLGFELREDPTQMPPPRLAKLANP
jgi:catechol 2,3-dioxygenase-like lactoylglutathione lyase family enzyme